MTLDQLRVFVAVAEQQHMTRAAEALHLTQSAASAAVSALEARYGARLFERVGRGLRLSEAGRIFLPEAKAVLARAEGAARTLEDLAGLNRGRVAMFASQTIASYWLPPRMVRFHHAYPQIALSLTVGNTAQVAQAVLAGEAELGFVEGAVDEPALVHAHVGSDRLAVVAAPDHPLAQAADLSNERLRGAAWVLREPGSGTRSGFEQALRRRGLDLADLKVSLELPSNEAVLAAVCTGGLLAAVSEIAAEPMLQSGRLSRLDLTFAARSFDVLIHRQHHRSQAARAFVDLLNQTGRKG